MDRSTWKFFALLLVASGCGQNAVPSADVQQVSMTSEYRRPDVGAPAAASQTSRADAPIFPEMAADKPSIPAEAAAESTSTPTPPTVVDAPKAVPSEKTPTAPAAEPVQSALAPRPLKLLVPEKSFTTISGGILRVSFDDIDLLKVLDAETVPNDVADHFPAWLNGLSGKSVRLRGFMKPPPREKELPFFLFVRDSKDCCFGANVKIYDQIAVKMKPGTTTDHIYMRPFDVMGTFVIKPVIREGKLTVLYFIEDATVFEKS